LFSLRIELIQVLTLLCQKKEKEEEENTRKMSLYLFSTKIRHGFIQSWNWTCLVSRKACEICISLVQKKKLKKYYFSSNMLPKQQSTSFWSQGILGVISNMIAISFVMH
jgi:hypothetical protein